MRAGRRRIEELLWVAGLSRATAPVWEWLRGGRAVAQSRRMQAFYGGLLARDALVFDIGANLGTMTRVFTALGARVVAVEPNADCLRHIELTTRREQVEVLQAAVGERNGVTILKVADWKDKMSSLSDEWREAVAEENRDYLGMWKREVTVPMVTLDALIGRYGMPAYIKVDVEGYEDQVMAGLSESPALTSFEFNRVFLQPALRAMENPVFDGAQFNYTLVDPVKFELRDWVGREELKQRIVELRDGAGLGDIFARRRSGRDG